MPAGTKVLLFYRLILNGICVECQINRIGDIDSFHLSIQSHIVKMQPHRPWSKQINKNQIN